MSNVKRGTLGVLVDKVEQRVEAGEKISIALVQKVAGQRMAGPMLLFPALLVVSPLSIIPGLPTLVGINTVLVAGQILLGREQIWLPAWLTRRSLPRKHGDRLLGFLRPISRTVDAVARPRWRAVLSAPLRRFGAVVCILVGAIMPLLEFIPFTSTVAAAIIATYGLALTARDGFLGLVWLALVAAAIGVGAMLVA
jgi:hypothetical protein